MRRSWNSLLWVGFAFTLVAVFSYIPLFVRFPATRDFPWANLLLFLVGGALLAPESSVPTANPNATAATVSGAVLGLLSLALFGHFLLG